MLRTDADLNTHHTGRMQMTVEVTLTHPAATFAAVKALEGMSTEPVRSDGELVMVPVADRFGAVMEAARRLSRAGVSAADLVVR